MDQKAGEAARSTEDITLPDIEQSAAEGRFLWHHEGRSVAHEGREDTVRAAAGERNTFRQPMPAAASTFKAPNPSHADNDSLTLQKAYRAQFLQTVVNSEDRQTCSGLP